MRTRIDGRQGFTLIELVVVMAIVAVLAGAAVPMATKFFTSKARAATRAELEEIAAAVLPYFRDTSKLPSSVTDLTQNPGVNGWAGPYLSISTTEAWSGATDIQVDAWARAYRFTTKSASLLEIASAGEDGTFGDASDIAFRIDVTPVRREETLAQLATLNSAITLYNRDYLPGTPLPPNYTQLLARLVATKYLPATAPYKLDAWGSAFQANPKGKSPVTAIVSPNVP
ncbi:MAG: prepilin-type N-terminal cleavage/methylation domain-containing protein [Planctomycetes bacterium]|nr:prepilin-type N-terminal cleavage/methylation domain-containing protein [Planctomycetota bacterium]